MLISCTTKGCMKSTQALLNKQDDTVICQACGKPISNVSAYTKRSLMAMGRILRHAEKRPFQVHCSACKGKRDILLVDGGKAGAKCASCGGDLKVSAAFLHAVAIHQEAERKAGDGD